MNAAACLMLWCSDTMPVGLLMRTGRVLGGSFLCLLLILGKSFGWLVIPRFGIVKKSQDGMYGFVWVLLGGVG
jgi:hypothetical protein